MLLKLLESPGSVRDPDRFAAWIRLAIVNHARSPPSAAAGGGRGSTGGSAAHAPAVQPPIPAMPSIAGDQARRLADALLRLDPRERAVLSLRFDEDLTFTEIAAALGQPTTTVKSRVARAIDRLRGLLHE